MKALWSMDCTGCLHGGDCVSCCGWNPGPIEARGLLLLTSVGLEFHPAFETVHASENMGMFQLGKGFYTTSLQCMCGLEWQWCFGGYIPDRRDCIYMWLSSWLPWCGVCDVYSPDRQAYVHMHPDSLSHHTRIQRCSRSAYLEPVLSAHIFTHTDHCLCRCGSVYRCEAEVRVWLMNSCSLCVYGDGGNTPVCAMELPQFL